MITKIYNNLLDSFNKWMLVKQIQTFDKQTNHNHLNNGYKVYRNLFSPISITRPQNFDQYGWNINYTISSDIALLSSNIIKELHGDIKSYIGDDCRLDNMYISWFDPSISTKSSVSENWHSDNCGNRLKLWICLKGQGGTKTLFLPGTHKKKYTFGVDEFLRAIGKKNKSIVENQTELDLCAGDVGIFDTNGLHRGYYGEGADERVAIVVEFISASKSNNIAKHTPCGPGSSDTGEVVFIEGGENFLKETNLLDDDLIHIDKEGSIYSIKNLSIK